MAYYTKQASLTLRHLSPEQFARLTDRAPSVDVADANERAQLAYLVAKDKGDKKAMGANRNRAARSYSFGNRYVIGQRDDWTDVMYYQDPGSRGNWLNTWRAPGKPEKDYGDF